MYGCCNASLDMYTNGTCYLPNDVQLTVFPQFPTANCFKVQTGDMDIFLSLPKNDILQPGFSDWTFVSFWTSGPGFWESSVGVAKDPEDPRQDQLCGGLSNSNINCCNLYGNNGTCVYNSTLSMSFNNDNTDCSSNAALTCATPDYVSTTCGGANPPFVGTWGYSAVWIVETQRSVKYFDMYKVNC
jgi:hypothetical protein